MRRARKFLPSTASALTNKRSSKRPGETVKEAEIIQIPSERMDSNSYLVEEDGHVIIIDGSSLNGIVEKVEAEGLTVDHLFLTHEHFDHIWFLDELREAFGMPVTACRLTSERIQDVKSNLSNIADVLYYFKTGIVREGRSRSFTCDAADITYEDEFSFSWHGHTFDFRRLPGHSPGSTIIIMDGGRVFSGDYLICGEEEILRLKDGSPEDYEAFARPVLESIPDGTVIYPGHGPVYVKGQEEGQCDGKQEE